LLSALSPLRPELDDDLLGDVLQVKGGNVFGRLAACELVAFGQSK
jgi:hypothetical protein